MTTGVAAVLLTISGALQAGSTHIAMFLTFRIICGVGAGMVITNTPVYMSEVSPPHTRGLLGGAHASSIMVAYIMTSFIALGLNFLKTDYAWRLQFVFMAFFALCLALSLYWIPESPRWLIEKGRYDEAWKILEGLHKSKSDPEGILAQAEMVQIRAQVVAESSQKTGYLYILSKPSLRKRALCSILVWLMGMSTGVLVIANLTPTIFGSLGFNQTLQFALAAVYNTCALIGCGVNAYLMDKVGRVGLLGMIALLYSGHNSDTV
jgi:MFS family permease